MALPFFGGASVIVCQGADLIAIRSRRPPQGDTAAVTAKCRVFGRGGLDDGQMHQGADQLCFGIPLSRDGVAAIPDSAVVTGLRHEC